MPSEYVSSLTDEERRNYFKKLTTSDGKQLPDPYILEEWSSDILKLPDIGSRDIDTYLIDTPSPFTKEAMKAYKSLDAYNFFVSGHVQDCQIRHIEDAEFCFIKSGVGKRIIQTLKTNSNTLKENFFAR